MYKITSAKLVPSDSGYKQFDIHVTVDKPVASISHNFEKRRVANSKTWIYRAEAGDLIQFYAYDGPSKGFGGRCFALHMADGSHEMLVGPWSSRDSVANHMFLDRPSSIECTADGYTVHVKIEVLEALGIKFDMVLKKGELEFTPVIEQEEEATS